MPPKSARTPSPSVKTPTRKSTRAPYHKAPPAPLCELPRYINIVGHRIPIVTAPKIDPEHSFGEWDHTTYTIKISTSQPINSQWSTLYHEVMHAVLYLSGWTEQLSEELEEGLVLAIEHLYVPVIRVLLYNQLPMEPVSNEAD